VTHRQEFAATASLGATTQEILGAALLILRPGLHLRIGGIAKKAIGTAVGFIPGGSVVKGIAGTALGLLSHKQPMATSAIKYQIANKSGTSILRGQVPISSASPVMSRPVLRASPVMPGGSIATSAGIMAPGGGLPPATFGGKRTGTTKRRKSTSSKRKRSSRSHSGSKRKKGRLKFGSKAYRQKYLGHK
jgi:hypothetical protein